MKRESSRKRSEDTLRRMLAISKNDYLIDQDEFGSYPEKVEVLTLELVSHPDKRNLASRGREAVIGFFMSGVWRSDESGSEADDEDEEQLSFDFRIGGERLPVDITCRDPTTGKYKMRTVSTQVATIGQWIRAVELQEDKNAQAERRIARNKLIGAALLGRTRGDLTAKIIDNLDLKDVA